MRKEKPLKYYPIAVRLKGRVAVVIGGGPVAERKVQRLRRAGVKVFLVCPQATSTLKRLAKERKIKWSRRTVQKKDVQDAHIVIAATNDRDRNGTIRRWTKKRQMLVNVVDRPTLSNFISPAVFYAGGAIITVYTDGADPILSRDLKNFLKERWDDFLSYRNRL